MNLTAEATEPVGAGIDFTDPDSRLARFYLTFPQCANVSLFAVVFLFLNYVPLWHTDVWGHLATGRWIVNHRALPDRDPFTRDASLAPAAGYSWLSQAAGYLTYVTGAALAGGDELRRFAGGVAALRFAHAALTTLKFAALAVALRRRSGSTSYAGLAILLILLVTLGNAGVARPQVLGECCAALLLIALSRPSFSQRAVVLVPLLMALWANLHASYAVGLLLMLQCFVGRACDRVRVAGWQPLAWWRDGGVCRLLHAGVLSGLAVAVLNPAGPSIYANTLAMAGHPVVRLMDEWQPLRWTSPGGVSFALSLLAVVSFCIAARRPLPLGSCLVLFAFGTQSVGSQRVLVWWFTLLPWAVAPLAGAVRDRFAVRVGVPSLRKTAIALASVGLALLWSIPAQCLLDGRPPSLDRSLSPGTPWRLIAQLRGLDDSSPPLAAVLRNYPEGRLTGSLYGSETQGDYLLWQFAEERPVFITTHVHLIGPERWQANMAIRSGSVEGLATLDREKVNFVVVEAEQNVGLCTALKRRADWRVLLDEAGDRRKADSRCRLFVAVRERI